MMKVDLVTSEEFHIRLDFIENQMGKLVERLKSLEKLLEQPSEERLVTRAQTAKILGVSPSTVDNYARDGELPRVYIGSSVRFRYSDIKAFIEARIG